MKLFNHSFTTTSLISIGILNISEVKGKNYDFTVEVTSGFQKSIQMSRHQSSMPSTNISNETYNCLDSGSQLCKKLNNYINIMHIFSRPRC